MKWGGGTADATGVSLVARRIEDTRTGRASYLVGCLRSGEAIIFDPPRDADRCIEAAAREGLRIAAVALTHIPCDMLTGARELADRTGALVLASAAGGARWTPRWVDRYPHRMLLDQDALDLGGLRIQAMHAPGWAPEQLAYTVTDRAGGAREPIVAVVGELAAPEGFARPHSDHEVARVLHKSLTRLLMLPEWTQIWATRPGTITGNHGLPQTTVGFERRFGRLGTLLDDAPAFQALVADSRRECTTGHTRILETNLDTVPLLQRLPEPLVLNALDERPAILDSNVVTVVDTRAWAVFRAGHLPGSIHAPLGRQLNTILTTHIAPDQHLTLVCDPGHADELVRTCVRLGLDRVEAIVPPALLHQHRQRLVAAPELSPMAASRALAAHEAILVDVRDPAERARGVIHGSLHIPADRLVRRAPDLAGSKVIVHCALGALAASAVSVLRRAGVNACNLSGGLEAWRRAGLPVTAPVFAREAAVPAATAAAPAVLSGIPAGTV